MLDLAWGARTDIGHRRSRNEDAYFASARVFAVADGMGGHARGDVAATIAIDGLRPLGDAAFARTHLLEAVRRSHAEIRRFASDRAEGDMGTTICGLAATDEAGIESLLVFNVGDSRVYRLHDRDLVQVSHDHSVVQELIDYGELDAAAACVHPERHVVTRSLGSEEDVLDIDWWTLDAVTGDRFLLCSDGLVKEIDVDEIAVALATRSPAQEVADDLVARALAAGGRDNITVVIVDVVRAADPNEDHLERLTDPRHVDARTGPIPGRGPADPTVVARHIGEPDRDRHDARPTEVRSDHDT